MMRLMKNKAIIFDIDGTAIDSPSQRLPSDRLVKAIRQIEDEYFICAATGRVWSFAEPVLKGLSLVDPCIISGGTQICNPATGAILWQYDIDKADMDAVLKISKEFPDYKALYNNYDLDAYLNGGHDVTTLEIDESVYFFELTFVPENIAHAIIQKLSKIEGIVATLVVAMRPGCKDIHVTNKNATKEHAIAELLKIINVEQSNTTGVGDGHNDTHLFNGVNHKVAMGNSVHELKNMSDEVIGSVSEDGFANYLESLAAG
jgi:HAD superfamily hydrolase (TIGR01484 family)